MLVYIAYGIGVLILAAAGILAWKNSRIIAEQRNNPTPRLILSSYTVHVTNHFNEQENKHFTPLFQVSYRDKEGTMYAYLGRVTGERELKLSAAAEIMDHKLADIIAKGILDQTLAMYEAAEGDEEKNMIARLAHRVKQSGGHADA